MGVLRWKFLQKLEHGLRCLFLSHIMSVIVSGQLYSHYTKSNFDQQKKNPFTHLGKFHEPMRYRNFMPRETVDQWDFSPGKPLGNLLPTKQDVLGVPRWPQVIYLAFMSVFPVSHFVLFGCFRSVIVLACICIFFCVVMSFFTSLRYEIVLLLSLHFFVAMVLGLLFWFSFVYFYVFSFCKTFLLSGRVNTWCCIFLLRCFLFSWLFFLPI